MWHLHANLQTGGSKAQEPPLQVPAVIRGSAFTRTGIKDFYDNYLSEEHFYIFFQHSGVSLRRGAVGR